MNQWFFSGELLPSENKEKIISDEYLNQWKKETVNRIMRLFDWVCIGVAAAPIIAWIIAFVIL